MTFTYRHGQAIWQFRLWKISMFCLLFESFLGKVLEIHVKSSQIEVQSSHSITYYIFHFGATYRPNFNMVLLSNTVPVIWNWKNSTILGHFVTQNFCLHELWHLLSFRMCTKASLTYRLWEIQNPLTQSWEIAICFLKIAISQDWVDGFWISQSL